MKGLEAHENSVTGDIAFKGSVLTVGILALTLQGTFYEVLGMLDVEKAFWVPW